MAEKTVAIIGVGGVGAGLAERLAASGYEVVLGVRPGRDVAGLLERCGGRARAASPAEAVEQAKIVFLAVPATAAVEALEGAPVAGRVVVDCANPLAWEDGPVWAPPPEGSTTAQLAAAYPEARWVKGFSTLGAEFHRDPDLGGTPVDIHLAGDDGPAKEIAADLARQAGFNPIDAGPLRNAAVLENLAVLWIHLAVTAGRGRHIAFQLVERRREP